ncbi:MAG TPA: GDSL-type esterase/lipase family protein [Gemmatimonadaceae bacterium]|nr:GDSL-type esterase/lipase family protein [Gemmatimonadaceae bacterium]
MIHRTRVLPVSLIAIMSAAPALVARGQSIASQPEWPAGVSALLERFDSTASSATTLDAAGRSALFTDDAIFLNAFGIRVDGRPAIDSAWGRLYGGRAFGSARIERIDRRVRVLAPHLVLVDHLERLTGQRGGGGTMEPRTTHITLVLRQRRAGDWRIIYYRAGDNRSLARERGERATLDALQNDWASLTRYRDANATLAAPAANESRVVFFGNSITESWAPLFPVMFPAKPYIGRGISGQTTPQLLARFRQDVVALRPKVVVILAGTNDIAGNTGPATLQMIGDNLRSMTEIALANGIRVVLSSVLPVHDYPWRPGLEPAAKIVALNTWMKSYAASAGATYLDYHSAMVDARQGLRADLSKDGVHPTEAGYRVMAPLVEKAIAAALRR